MIATLINVGLVLLGSILGMLLRGKISDRAASGVTRAVALGVMVIGLQSALKTQDALCVIICLVAGTLLGEWARIEDRLDGMGELLQNKLVKKGENSRFTEGFVSASVLFCVGSMAIMGSLEAGLNHNYMILVSKGVIDGITSITLAATMGLGVAFSAGAIFLYQGGLTLLASVVGPLLSSAGINELSATGGAMMIAISFNMLGFGKEKIRVGNMLPSIFLPFFYLPLADLLVRLF
ncbi:MAG: DUF554 domain-containing protein [Oscillospiraceae bacterium]|nr:DUF554 domain-containing protein [Oscillospiraceae bacterium]